MFPQDTQIIKFEKGGELYILRRGHFVDAKYQVLFRTGDPVCIPDNLGKRAVFLSANWNRETGEINAHVKTMEGRMVSLPLSLVTPYKTLHFPFPFQNFCNRVILRFLTGRPTLAN
jgi:hypothetical protein